MLIAYTHLAPGAAHRHRHATALETAPADTPADPDLDPTRFLPTAAGTGHIGQSTNPAAALPGDRSAAHEDRHPGSQRSRRPPHEVESRAKPVRVKRARRVSRSLRIWRQGLAPLCDHASIYLTWYQRTRSLILSDPRWTRRVSWLAPPRAASPMTSWISRSGPAE